MAKAPRDGDGVPRGLQRPVPAEPREAEEPARVFVVPPRLACGGAIPPPADEPRRKSQSRRELPPRNIRAAPAASSDPPPRKFRRGVHRVFRIFRPASAAYPRGGRGVAAISTEYPRGDAASAEHPRGARGVAATPRPAEDGLSARGVAATPRARPSGFVRTLVRLRTLPRPRSRVATASRDFSATPARAGRRPTPRRPPPAPCAARRSSARTARASTAPRRRGRRRARAARRATCRRRCCPRSAARRGRGAAFGRGACRGEQCGCLSWPASQMLSRARPARRREGNAFWWRLRGAWPSCLDSNGLRAIPLDASRAGASVRVRARGGDPRARSIRPLAPGAGPARPDASTRTVCWRSAPRRRRGTSL